MDGVEHDGRGTLAVFVTQTGPWNIDRAMHADKVNHYAIRDGKAYTPTQPTRSLTRSS